MARPVWRLLAVLLHVEVASAARMPDPDVIGADLLVRVAGPPCDMRAAWRVMNSSSLRPGWLTKTGSAGETPLMAATRAACPEIVALIVLHPEFDDKTISRVKLRRQLADHAMKTWHGKENLVQWSLSVVLGIRNGKVSQEELKYDPKIAATDFSWFLPEPGEWMPPMTLEEMGVFLPMRPALPEAALQEVEMQAAVYSGARAEVRLEDLVKLWYLLISHLRAPEFSEQRANAARHIRSIGWSLFFGGGKDGLIVHQNMIKAMCTIELPDIPTEDDPDHEHIRRANLPVDLAYRRLHTRLGRVWNKTGGYILL